MENYPLTFENPEDSPEKIEKRRLKKETKKFERRWLAQKEAEQLGHAVVSAEQKSSKNREQYTRDNAKKVDLLVRSANIEVVGATLRQIFEDKQISEQALERLIVAYEQGKDIESLLKQEIAEKEKNYERDPQLRGRRPSLKRSIGTLDELLQKLEPTKVSRGDARHLEQAKYEVSRLKHRAHRRRQADVVLGTVIVALSAAVIILLLTR